MDEQKIVNFYKNWLKFLPHLNEGYIFNSEKNLLTPREIFSELKIIVNDFLSNKLNEFEKIILLPGIRGVGKTTLLMQLFSLEKFLTNNDQALKDNLGKLHQRFYLDTGKLKEENISLRDFFEFYQKERGFNFVSLKEKYLLLLDEIHFDERWGLFLKNVFDATKGHKNILIIATGSSAIKIKMIADLARRSTTREVFPLKFNEYLLLTSKISFDSSVSDDIKKILFNSKNAKEAFRGLKRKSLEIGRFFLNTPLDSERDFFEIGGFPFVNIEKNKIKIYELTKDIIYKTIVKDIIALEKFKSETVAKVFNLLYLLANSDVISYDKLKKSLKIEDQRTLEGLIESLVLSGILVPVKTYGKTYGPTRKTPKFLFISPSIRSAILDGIFQDNIEGKKLEDYFALIFEKDIKKGIIFGVPKLSYDIAEGGADFVLTLRDRNSIIIEVGFNKKETRQVEKTMKKVKNSKYGLVFGSSDLELVGNSIVKVPLRFLLLL